MKIKLKYFNASERTFFKKNNKVHENLRQTEKEDFKRILEQQEKLRQIEK